MQDNPWIVSPWLYLLAGVAVWWAAVFELVRWVLWLT